MIKLRTLLQEIATDNIGYHVGDGKSVSETLSDARLRADRQSKVGFLGTGVYFFGDPETAEDYRKFSNERPGITTQLQQVDLRKYRLFKPESPNEFVAALRMITVKLYKEEIETLKEFINKAVAFLKTEISGKTDVEIEKTLRQFAEDIKGSGEGVQLSNRLLDSFDGIDLRGTDKDHFGTGSLIFKNKIKPGTFKPIQS